MHNKLFCGKAPGKKTNKEKNYDMSMIFWGLYLQINLKKG